VLIALIVWLLSGSAQAASPCDRVKCASDCAREGSTDRCLQQCDAAYRSLCGTVEKPKGSMRELYQYADRPPALRKETKESKD
jgi:hypothetical protein